MLSENIKAIRKSKGLSQQELALKLNVVRQTVSKWEQGLSVPDAGLLLSLSEVLETPVSTLLGENVMEPEADGIKEISAKLEAINLQLARRKTTWKRILRWLFIMLSIVLAAIFAVLLALESPYLGWDYSDPETAVLGVALHVFEWLFIRAAPVILIGAIIGIFLTGGKNRPAQFYSLLPFKKSPFGFLRGKGGTFWRSKKFLAVLLLFLCAAVLFWWNTSFDPPAEAAGDEIALRIKLDTKEDFGVLLIAYDANGSGGRGGISNADKSLLRHDEQLFYTLPEHAFDNPSDVENLSIQFTIITQYVEPNFEEIYPEEYTIPVEPILLNADYGESYFIVIRGDKTNGYSAAWI